MKTEQQIFDTLDRFMELFPKTQDIESVITGLDWVLDRVDDDDLVEIFGIE